MITYLLCLTPCFVFRFNTITRPFDGKLTKTKALMMLCVVWGYTIPWAVLPSMEIWGRFVPGLNKLQNLHPLHCIDLFRKCYTAIHFKIVFRGIPDAMHLRLLDQYVRQSSVCCCYIHHKLYDPNVDDSLLL